MTSKWELVWVSQVFEYASDSASPSYSPECFELGQYLGWRGISLFIYSNIESSSFLLRLSPELDMFSETIYIRHCSGSGKVLENGYHNQIQDDPKSLDTRENSMRSYYKSHTVEKLYGDSRARKASGREREVSCFVRSEIKWVFLKSLKVSF